jgi:hypothetical protein
MLLRELGFGYVETLAFIWTIAVIGLLAAIQFFGITHGSHAYWPTSITLSSAAGLSIACVVMLKDPC